MDEPRFLADVLGHVRQEGDHIVIERLLQFIDAVDGEIRPLANHRNCLSRDDPELGLGFTGVNFDFEPGLEFGLVGPDRPHFGTRVALDHGLLLFESRFIQVAAQ